MVEAIVAASLGLAGTVFAAYMLHRQKARETAMTGEVEEIRAEDRFRDDLMEQVRFLAGRVDELSKQVQQQQAAYADLRQEHGALLRAYDELEEKYVTQKLELEKVRDTADRQAHDLGIAKRMLRQVYDSSPPSGSQSGGSGRRKL